MKFGVCFVPLNNWLTLPRFMELAEAVGFDHGWLADSHVIWNEVYEYLVLCAQRTQTLSLGTLVTNPVTRHPTVVAGAIATLDLISGGRAVVGIGKGDSAVRVLGLRPARLRPFREAVLLIRDLCRGEAVMCDGTRIRIDWLRREDPSGRPRRIPLYVAAYGPRTLELAGEVADGVVLQIAAPSVIRWSLEHVRAGAAAAGRSLDEIDVVAATPCCISDDLAAARDQVRYFPAAVANHVRDLLARYPRSELPVDLLEDMDLIKDYDYREHGVREAKHAAYVTDAAVEKFTVIGPLERCTERIRELQACGVTQLCIYLVSMEDPAIESTIRSFGRIIQAFR